MFLRQPEGIACIPHQLLTGQSLSGKLHADVVEPMGFIDHHHAGVGQKMSHAAVAHIEVGKQQVMIDHHHVGLQRLLTRLIDMAALPVRAVRPHAIVLGGAHQGHHRGALIQRRQLGKIAGTRDPGPAFHIGHGAQHLRILGSRATLAHTLQPLRT